MDTKENEVFIRNRPDPVDEDVDDELTVHLPQEEVAGGATTASGSNANANANANARAENTQENLAAMLSYLMDEMKILKQQIGGQSVPKVDFSDKIEIPSSFELTADSSSRSSSSRCVDEC